MRWIACCTVLLFATQSAFSQECCCDHCGCHASCQKVCRTVCEVKRVPKTTYDCECEEFCVPGPSVRSTVCDECGHKHHVYTPTCGKLRTRTKMIKNETFEEKVVYKWVVENVCCACAEQAGANPNAAEPLVLQGGPPASSVDAARAAFDGKVARDEPPVAGPAEGPAAARPKFDVRRLFAPLAGRP